MKKLIILLSILILSSVTFAQIDTVNYQYNQNKKDNKYVSVLSSGGSISGLLQYIINNGIDTNLFVLNPNKVDNKFDKVLNKINVNGKSPGTISASLIYLLNNNLAQTDKPNTFTATQYFNRLVCDTMIVNHMDSVHSTYWFSASGDTIGYIDASTEKVAFFKQMTIGNLTTNTTVAENFIRSNQVQTDTLIPHSPLILAGDTTIAKKIFADSLMTQKVKAGNILINGVDNSIRKVDTIIANVIKSGDYTSYLNITRFGISLGSGTTYGNNFINFGSNTGTLNSYDGTKQFSSYSWDKYNAHIDSNLNVSKSIITRAINVDTLNLLNTKLYFGGGYFQINNYMEIANKYVFNPTNIAPITNNLYDLGISGGTWRNLYLGTCLYSPTAIFNPTTEPSTPTAGQIYFNSADNKFYGYNGTAWKQLDN